MLLLYVVLGGVGWTLAEYGIHRFLGHRFTRNPFGVEHTAHHAGHEVFGPAYLKVLASLAVGVVLVPSAVGILGQAGGIAWCAGFYAAYAGYEIVHRRLHMRAPVGAYGRWARKHHFAHHFMNPGMNHGVTSPVWDWVFRTHLRVDQVRVPSHRVPRWLGHPVASAFDADYRVG